MGKVGRRNGVTLLAPAPTDQVEPAIERRSRPLPSPRLRDNADMAALLLAVAALMGPVVHGGGGRDQHLVVLGLTAVIPALALGRVWRLPSVHLALALGPGSGALIVCAAAPTGWAGAGDVARLLYAGLLYLSVRAIVKTVERRTMLLIAVSIGGLYQFDQAYLSWWGRGDASHAMSGTFYASNVFGAYMAGTGLAALALAAAGPRRGRLVGMVAAPFCLSAVAFSASRATIGLCLLAVAAISVLLLVQRSWRELGRCVAVLAATLGLVTILSSSLLMANGGGALSAASQKAASSSQTLESSGGFRLEWWRAGILVGQEHPVSGAGFGSFAGAESRFQPVDSERSTYAHNVLLQAWADGGVALALPVGLALVATALLAIRRLRSREAAGLVGVGAASAVVAHALVDFDAQYPASLALSCLLVGLVATVPRGAVRRSDAAVTHSRWPAAAAVLTLAAIGLLAGLRFDVADAAYRRGEIAGGAWTGADGPLRDARFDVLRLRKGQHDRALLDRTEPLQQDSAAVTWSRAKGLAAEGRLVEARHLAETSWRQRAAQQPGQVIGYAEVLSAVGQHDAATHVLVAAFRRSSVRPTSGDEPTLVLAAVLHTAGPDVARCLVAELPSRLQPVSPSALPATCGATLLPFQTGSDS